MVICIFRYKFDIVLDEVVCYGLYVVYDLFLVSFEFWVSCLFECYREIGDGVVVGIFLEIREDGEINFVF